VLAIALVSVGLSDTVATENRSRRRRRRHSVAGPVDESLTRDLSWSFTNAIYQQERGENPGPELVEVSEEQARALVERFRQKWEGT
jgi:uncharacterized alpha-E superfamily protein